MFAHALPFLQNISTLTEFQNFAREDSSINLFFDRQYFLLSALIASYLESVESFREVSTKLRSALEFSSMKYGVRESFLLNYLDKFEKYVDERTIITG
jgi:hypothetical protein